MVEQGATPPPSLGALDDPGYAHRWLRARAACKDQSATASTKPSWRRPEQGRRAVQPAVRHDQRRMECMS